METLDKSYWLINEDALTVLGRAALARLDGTFDSIDKTLDFPIRLYAALVPDSKIYLSPSITQMGNGAGKAPGPLNNTIPAFPLSTIDFQTGATTGGTISISLPASTVGMFRRCAFSFDSSGTITASFSGESGSIAGLTNAGNLFIPNSLPVGWVDLECINAGGQFKTALSATDVIENAVGGVSRIVCIAAGGGGAGGAANAGDSADAALGIGLDTFTIVFAVPRYNTSYVVQAGIYNNTDPNPQFQSTVVTNKTVNGFTIKLNAPTDSANYFLSYLVPALQTVPGETVIPAAQTTITTLFALPLPSTNYAVSAMLVDYTDPNPQFQPVTITAKTTSGFTALWNDPTDSANYRLAYHVSEWT